MSLEAGAALFMNTMGIGVGDVDRDGDWDMALSNIGGNKLMRNDGKGGFVEDVQSGIERPRQQADYSSVTWGGGFYDFNLDGWEDLYIAAGNLQQGARRARRRATQRAVRQRRHRQHVPRCQRGDGCSRHRETRRAWRSPTTTAMATSTCSWSTRAARRICSRTSRPAGPNHWLEVRAAGTTSDRDGCGATVEVDGRGPIDARTVPCGSATDGSSNQPTAHFGLGRPPERSRSSVRWPAGPDANAG